MSDNIKVVVKVRPLISREIEDKLSYQWRVRNDTLYQLDQSGREVGSSFTFDKVYDEETKTSDVYKDIAKPIVEATTAGFNGTIFAYGQTSSGKTYTMTGTEHSPGLIPLAVCNLFEIIKSIPNRDFLVRVSYLEIYNETVKDLLDIEKKNIKVQDTLQGGVKVDVTEVVTTSPEEVFKYLKEGEANRQTGATNMNEESSRSHSIFQIIIESREHIEGDEEATGCVNVSQLNLVDLAGSERAGQTGATGLRFKEGTHINKSLLSLALVIKQLSEDPNKYVNYRDSKLTRILQNSLGGNAKTSIICAITPAAVEETISTLQFANRAKAIKNKPEVNAVATDATMIQSLTKRLSMLQAQLETKKDLEVMLESKKNVEQDNQQLQNKIAALQKLILNGFGQRSSAEIIGPRRKNVQPRRVTISTLHSIDDDHVTSAPKFCTPSLKYNPMLFSNTTDFVPIQNANKLETLYEEVRIVTPPPRDKNINPNDEIIDLDSDNDVSTDMSCSPYHRCYVSSKTPPCVLRKNAKAAEQNLKEIEELTKREKIYEPRVNELIEKLEHNTTVIAKLRDDINTLTIQSKEKDFQIEHLKAKIGKSENEIKTVTSAKVDMEAKLVDLEVLYETLKQNTKRREEELLSLLDDKPKKNEDIGKMASRIFEKDLSHFMDMSKDISLVNSDNESSISNTNDGESSSQTHELNADIVMQLTSKVETIQKLESNLCTQNKKIEALELSCREFEKMITTFKASLSQTEHENALLKATIDTLNSTISNQKMNLESAHSNLDSYNSMIKELQNKLKEKESNFNINDSILEKMIANEEKFIANNDNIKNIIDSFKSTLDSKNKEIDSLKSKQFDNIEGVNIKEVLTEQLKATTAQIDLLNEETQKCKIQINEKDELINKLVSEKNEWRNIQHQLSEKLTTLVEKHDKLEKEYLESINLVANLKITNKQLSHSASEKEKRDKELVAKNEELNIQIETLSNQIVNLEDDIKFKDNILIALTKEESESEEHLAKAKSSVNKLQNVVMKLTGNVQEVPEIIDNFVVIFSTMNDSLDILERAVAEVTSQKEDNNKIISNLRNELVILNEKHNQEIKVLQSRIDALITTEKEATLQKDSLQQELNKITLELEMTSRKLDTTNVECRDLEMKLDQITERYTGLQSDILVKNSLVTSLQTSADNLRSEIINLRKENKQMCQNFTNDINHLKGSLRNLHISFEELVSDKETEIVLLENKLKEITNNLNEKTTEISNFIPKINAVTEKSAHILKTILEKVIDLGNNLNIENYFLCDTNDVDIDNIHEQIVHILDTIANSIKILNNYKNEDYDNIDKKVSQAKHEMSFISGQNTKCTECSCLETKHQELLNQLEVIRTENNTLKKDLMDTNTLLVSLRNELQAKVTIMDEMEAKILKWQELDFSLKQLVDQLQIENMQLKSRCTELEANNRNIYDVECNLNYTGKKTTGNLNETRQQNTPPSLLSICCEKIVDYIHPKENSLSTSSSDASVDHVNEDIPCNNCEMLLSELTASHNSNLRLKDSVMKLENINRQLLHEQLEIHKEVKLLLEPAYELQKKVTNHRTNLSTLTATTYAENKLLKSQVKALQHHHSRFHMVCQRDIPAVKQQLGELMLILKNDSSYFINENSSFTRFLLPDTLENKSALSIFQKDETTLDGDLLMLDTTLTTSANNTLLGHDQTCLDTTQTFLYNEVACQTSNSTQLTGIDTHVDMGFLSEDYKEMRHNLEALKHENYNLREQLSKYPKSVATKVETQTSPIKIDTRKCDACEKYRNEISETLNMQQKQNETIKLLSQELFELKIEKEKIDEKYKNLTLEIPSTDVLIRKLNAVEKEKDSEIRKLAETITNHHRLEMKRLQDENDTLSTQVMENITEVDDLNNKLQTLKELNTTLVNKCTELERITDENKIKLNNTSCPQCNCTAKDDMTRSLPITATAKPHAKLNRSMSESDTSSRLNKICTLQNELHAGKEDCKELTEDVTTIKNHLDRNNLSMGQNMELDDSIVDVNIFAFTKDFEVDLQSNKVMCNIPEEQVTDIYKLDKIDCINYYKEITGTEIENFDYDMKLIDVMKMFYNNIITKHNMNAEILVNKLKEYEQSRNEIEVHVKSLSLEYEKIKDMLEDKDKQFEKTSNVLLIVKNNVNTIVEEISRLTESEKNVKAMMIFKDKLLNILDSKFGFTSASVFEHLIDTIVNKHEKELNDVVNRNDKIQQHLESVIAKLDIASENLLQMKSQLTDKENEYNLLKAQKERIHEISNAVTLDIIKKENELRETVTKGCQKLVEFNIVNRSDIDWSLPINENLKFLVQRFVTEVDKLKQESEKEYLVKEIMEIKTTLESKEKLLEILKEQNVKLQEINKSMSLNLTEKDNLLREQKFSHDELNTVYEAKVKENETNLNIIHNVTREINVLKEEIINKQSSIESLEREVNTYKQSRSQKDSETAELINRITTFEKEVNSLKTINDMLIKEKESCALDLARSKETITQNKLELEKMTSDILVLRESVKDNVSVIETLKVEAKSLLQQNLQLKKEFDEKCKHCSRLEMNIRTHEKTAEIQSKMIIRLQKQKEEDDQVIDEKSKQLEQLTQARVALQNEYEQMQDKLKSSKEEIDVLTSRKDSLELRIAELETDVEGCRRRTSVEPVVDASRRRRQSIYDSQRVFSDVKQESGDNYKMEAAFQWKTKSDDHLADAEDDSSNRSAPLRLSKGRDSQHSRGDQDDEIPSRPQSVQATRRRRQSSHDLHRSVSRTTPDPHDLSRRLLDDLNSTKLGDALDARDLEPMKLELLACKQELEELRERYKELDEECDTCAEYLRERDEQCSRLKKEKATLENIVAELREKLQAANPQQQESKRVFSDASVNTDEDWANLHSVVVDRMSYDAEVEKRKRLTKTIEDLRSKNQDLRTTIAKMQKSFEKSSGKDKELEAAKKELEACKVELEELRERYKELDEECETCAEYLRQRDDQCRKLKEAKIALEAKLQEFQSDHSGLLQSSRKRRQTLHDQNRGSAVHADVHDAATETSEDFLSYQVERDQGKPAEDKSREIKQLKMAVEKLTQQKTALEHQLMTMSHPMYIATGSAIVQNQQLTDVMKENQKLKKINAKLVTICKKRGKDSNRENEDPSEQLA